MKKLIFVFPKKKLYCQKELKKKKKIIMHNGIDLQESWSQKANIPHTASHFDTLIAWAV